MKNRWMKVSDFNRIIQEFEEFTQGKREHVDGSCTMITIILCENCRYRFTCRMRDSLIFCSKGEEVIEDNGR